MMWSQNAINYWIMRVSKIRITHLFCSLYQTELNLYEKTEPSLRVLIQKLVNCFLVHFMGQFNSFLLN